MPVGGENGSSERENRFPNAGPTPYGALWRSRLKKGSPLLGIASGKLEREDLDLPMLLFLVVPLCVWVLDQQGVACCGIGTMEGLRQG